VDGRGEGGALHRRNPSDGRCGMHHEGDRIRGGGGERNGAVSERCAAGEVALGSSLQCEWHGLGQTVVIVNQGSNVGAAFEAKRAESALGYWEFVLSFELTTGL